MANRNDILIGIRADLSKMRSDFKELKGVVSGVAKNVKNTWDGVTGTFAKLDLAIGGVRQSFDLLASPIRGVLDTAGEFEFLQTRLISLYGSVEDGTRAFQRFNQVAASTPFELQNVVEAGAQIRAFGGDAESLIGTISDLAAFMGVDIVEAANAFGRAFAAGAGAADILRERGVLTLVKSFKGVEDLTKLTLPEFRDALISTLQDPAANIAGASDRLSLTYRGLVSNLSDSVNQLKAAVGEELLPSFKRAVPELIGLLNGIRDSLPQIKRTAEDLTTAILALVAAFGAAKLAMLGLDGIAIATMIAFDRLKFAVVTLNAVLLSNPWVAVAAAIAALSVVLYRNVKAYEEDADAARDSADASDEARRAYEAEADALRDRTQALTESRIAKVFAEVQDETRQATANLLEFKRDLETIDTPGLESLIDRLRRAQQAFFDSEGGSQQYSQQLQYLQNFISVAQGILDDRNKDTETSYKTSHQRLIELEKAYWDRYYNTIQARLKRRNDQKKYWDEQLAELNRQEREAEDRRQYEAEQKRQALALKTVEFYQQIAISIGEAIGGSLAGAADAWRIALKGILRAALEALRAHIYITKGFMTAQGILNPTTLLKNLPLFATLEGLFAVAQAYVAQFATGGIVTAPVVGVIGENIAKSGPEAIVPLKQLPKYIREALPDLATGGGLSDKLLTNLNKRMESIEGILQGSPKKTGKETAKAIGSFSRGALA